MARAFVVLALSLVFSFSVFASNSDYYKIKSVSVTEVPSLDFHPLNTVGDCTSLQQTAPAADFLDLNEIIDIGRAVWAIIKEGKPVVRSEMNSANALPRGVKCWTDLQGWSAPRSRSYRVIYRNGFDMPVVDFTYRLMFTSGGNVNGVGAYISNATFVPANLTVAWGFEFNAKASIPAVTNMGTTANPLAGMQMNMQWSVDSVVSHVESTESYFITGEGYIVRMN